MYVYLRVSGVSLPSLRGGLGWWRAPDRHIEHCRWAEQRAMAHQDERWGGLAMQYGGYGGLFMG